MLLLNTDINEGSSDRRKGGVVSSGIHLVLLLQDTIAWKVKSCIYIYAAGEIRKTCFSYKMENVCQLLCRGVAHQTEHLPAA